MADTPFISLDTSDDWAAALDRSERTPVWVFKHSSACPISANAHDEMTRLAEADDVPVYRVVVQESRAVSDEITEALGVKHETPQAILVHDRSAVFDASHYEVTADTLRDERQRVPAE